MSRPMHTRLLALLAFAVLTAGAAVGGFRLAAAGAATDPGTGDTVGEFVYGVTPARLFDSRTPDATIDGLESGAGPLTNDAPITVAVAGRGPVPADATSVLLNVTVVAPNAAGFVSVWPSGPFPGTSNLNFGIGDVVPNMVFTSLANGSITVMASHGNPHLVIDVVAYLSDQPAAALP